MWQVLSTNCYMVSLTSLTWLIYWALPMQPRQGDMDRTGTPQTTFDSGEMPAVRGGVCATRDSGVIRIRQAVNRDRGTATLHCHICHCTEPHQRNRFGYFMTEAICWCPLSFRISLVSLTVQCVLR